MAGGDPPRRSSSSQAISRLGCLSAGADADALGIAAVTAYLALRVGALLRAGDSNVLSFHLEVRRPDAYRRLGVFRLRAALLGLIAHSDGALP